MKVGFVNTFVDIAVLQLAINTWGYAYFDLGKWPDWAGRAVNDTSSVIDATAAALDVTTALP